MKDWNQTSEQYGDVCYKNCGYAKITATVADDAEALFTPCTYKLGNVKVVDGAKLQPIEEIVSFRGRFCEKPTTINGEPTTNRHANPPQSKLREKSNLSQTPEQAQHTTVYSSETNPQTTWSLNTIPKILDVLVSMEDNGKSKSVINSTRKELNNLARNANLEEPNEVKALIAKRVHQSRPAKRCG